MGQKKTILYKKINGELTKKSESNYSKPVNPNLLDNPDFRVNQRGQSEYSSFAEIYSLDRWKTSGIVKALDGGGIEWTHLGSIVWQNDAHYTDVIQHRPADGIFESERLVTLSACINGQVYSVSGKRCFSQTFTIDGHQVELIAWYGPTYRIRTYGEEDYTITVSWVKLELGGIATPFVPPKPGAELLECQRYFEKGHYGVHRVSDSYPNFLSQIVFKVPKRAVPTVKVRLINNITDVTDQYFNNPDDVFYTNVEIGNTGWIPIDKGTLATDVFSMAMIYEASADL